MPVLNLYLFTLAKSTDAQSFIQHLKQTPSLKVIVASRPRHVVIHPNILDNETLTKTPWDLLVLVQNNDPENPNPIHHLLHSITNSYKIPAGIPSNLLRDYAARSDRLKSEASTIPLTGALDKLLRAGSKDTSQNLEVSPSLLEFMNELEKTHRGPVTMLNLLHFHHPDGKKSYYQYGQAFIPVAGKRGGHAKLVGNVVPAPEGQDPSRGEKEKEEWWNEISIVHYPSIHHFCDMLAGEDYQAINEKYRLSVHDFDTQQLGHQWLALKGYKSVWGVDRHILGSQIFDYWWDTTGNMIEHYADGDLVNEETPIGHLPAGHESLAVWGPNVPAAFLD